MTTIGDTIFLSTGNPAVVTAKNPLNGELVVNKTHERVAHQVRHGYLNGLEVQERARVTEILDRVEQERQPEKRMDLLQGTISEMSEDPRNLKLVNYLKAEMAHVMYSHNVRPRNFIIPADQQAVV